MKRALARCCPPAAAAIAAALLPGGAHAPAAPPAHVGQLGPDRQRPVVRIDAPAYASDRSRTRRVRIRWRGSDAGSGIARYRLEARSRTNVATRWRVVVRRTRRSGATFRGRPGHTYSFRLRARDRAGNLSRHAYDQTIVPLDDRSRRLRLSRGWRRVRHDRAYGGSVTRGRRAGLEAGLRFRGSGAALVATRTPRGARLLVTVGSRSRVVSLRGRHRHRRVVFRSRQLRPGRHLLQVRTLDGGVADIDALGVDTGPGAPRR